MADRQRVVVVGATGNLGTGLLRRLAGDPDIEVVGIARRPPESPSPPYDAVRWVRCDISEPTSVAVVAEAMAGADAAVNLAWLLRPSHDLDALSRTNVDGARHVIDAALHAGVGHLVVVSSVGAYSPGPKDSPVAESWPTEGVGSSWYSRQKAMVERILDGAEADHPELTIARVRPGFVLQRTAGAEITRYFLGPLVPMGLLRWVHLPVVPLPRELVFQVVHADDVGDAIARILERRAGGAFNLAAEPVLGPADVASVLGGRPQLVGLSVLKRLAGLTWRLHLQPSEAGWLDLAAGIPVLSTQRAREVLGWAPTHDARETLREMVAAMIAGEKGASPVLAPARR